MSSNEAATAESYAAGAEELSVPPLSRPRASSRPYAPLEPLTIDLTVSEAVAGLVANRSFRRLARSLLGKSAQRCMDAALEGETVGDFERGLGTDMLSALLDKTAQGVEYRGIEHIAEGKASLFISNHRDILLDSALLSRLLLSRGLHAPHPAIGDNLLKSGWTKNFFKLVDCFVIRRNLKGKELYAHSRQVSEFVHELISGGESVWIAQRQGRTRDGTDRTEPALLRMLLLAYERSTNPHEAPLPVTPIAVSYQYEPCDLFKAACLIGATVRNSPTEQERRDTAHMLAGIMQPKGRICLTIQKPIMVDHAAAKAKGCDRADFIADLGAQVDREITRGYATWPTNYVAHDLLHGSTTHADRYSNEERAAFQEYVADRATKIDAPSDAANNAMLQLYARAVDQAEAVDHTH